MSTVIRSAGRVPVERTTLYTDARFATAGPTVAELGRALANWEVVYNTAAWVPQWIE